MAAATLGLLLGTPSALAQAGAQPSPGNGDWTFEVTLDGKPIGTHRFVASHSASSSRDGFDGTVTGNADFTVRLLGIPVYRYHHASKASWRGGCIEDLQADTDDNGTVHQVRATRKGGGLQVTTPAAGNAAGADAGQSHLGCIMDYAYWSPSLPMQSRLLNTQTGRLDEVRVTSLGVKDLKVGGAMAKAEGWRIEGPERPVDVWYAVSDGRWIGLDARLEGNRVLAYRLP